MIVTFQVELSKEQMLAEMTTSNNQKDVLMSGFKHFGVREACPDEKCLYYLHSHYHCIRPRCHHATDRADPSTLVEVTLKTGRTHQIRPGEGSSQVQAMPPWVQDGSPA